MTIQTTATTKNNLFSDQESNIINRLTEGLESIERDKARQNQDSVAQASASMRGELAQLLDRDINSIPQHIIDNLSGAFHNWAQMKSNPLALSDLRHRVEQELEAAVTAEEARKTIVYTATRLVEKSRVTAHKITVNSRVSDMPKVVTYNILPPASLLAFKGVEQSAQSGFTGQTKALALLQSPAAAEVLFDSKETPKGQQVVKDMVEFWKGLGFTYFDRPTGFVVAAIRNKGKVKGTTVVSLEEIANANTRAFTCGAAFGDEVWFVNRIFTTNADARIAAGESGLKYVKTFTKILP